MPDYFNDIEGHFAMRRGTPFVVSPKDWALMKEWHEAGIPLPVVIEAIDSVFDKQDAKDKKINGLRYVRHAVKELWNERKELQVGASESAPEEDPLPLLEALAEAVPAEFGPRIRALISEKSVPRIEEKLMEVEEELLTALATEELREEARTMSAGAGQRTEDATLRRLVREKFALPRLTLFR
ncbi:MAG TPA: hypothetical protein VEU30_05585 [Thermoanaerobaculia bacterium]|nr:hypothetical protein [Thermoanaerobaculia bacterium]